MSRETKFRGKRKDNGKWVYGYLFVSCGRSYIIRNDTLPLDWDGKHYEDLGAHIVEVIPETVGWSQVMTETELIQLVKDMWQYRYGLYHVDALYCHGTWMGHPDLPELLQRIESATGIDMSRWLKEKENG